MVEHKTWEEMAVKPMKQILLVLCLLPLLPALSGTPLEQSLRRAIASVRGTVGIAVITDEGDTLTLNNGEPYPLMSVMKLHQAIYVAHWLSGQGLDMDYEVTVEPSDLKPDTYSPLRDRHPEGGFKMRIGDLLAYTLQLSDNNACDLLFRLMGGPRATDAHIRERWHGRRFAIAATEDDMHRDPSLCPANHSTPLETAQLIHRLFADTLPNPNLQHVRRLLLDCRTGLQRIPAGIPDPDVQIAHKTGTSDRDASGRWTALNDVAHVRLPDGRGYSLAVFIKDSFEDMEENERIMAQVSALVYEALKGMD